VGAVSERFDFLAHGANLLFGGLRLHDDEHNEYPEMLSLASNEEQGKRSGKSWEDGFVGASETQETPDCGRIA
jgi:hypothetical protein